jgi:GntR family transcriptional regulator
MNRMGSLIESVAEPLHRQVYRVIAEAIASGELKPGTRLPPERAMCERFGVSRATVRRALRQLSEEGLVESSAGRGSFVGSGPLGETANRLMSFTELGTSRGLLPSARLLHAGVRASTIDEAEQFAIAPGAELFELKRVRLLDDVPVCVDHSRIPLALGPFLPSIDFSCESLYRTLEANGVALLRADYAVQAVPASSAHAELLGIASGEPLLLAETVGYGEASRVIELAETYYRGDRYRFYTTLTRRRGS